MTEPHEEEPLGPEETSEALIAVHWKEEGYYQPPASFIAQANASDPAIREQFTEDKYPDCFTAYADLLTWSKPWDTVLDTSNAPWNGSLRRAERLLQLRRTATWLTRPTRPR